MAINGPHYRTLHMPPTPRGRSMELLEGSGDDIRTAGWKMKDLGDRMQKAANALNRIANGTVGNGLSIDKLRESADEVHADLRQAGERYSPSGDVLMRYGEAVTSVRPPLNRAVRDSESSWTRVRTASIALEEAAQAGDDTTSLQFSFDTAVAEFESDREPFDGLYDTWSDAYNAARTGLQEANDNGARDSWLDNSLPWLEGLGTILTWVGVALAVAACLIGAPWLLIAGAMLGLAALINTCLLAAGGRADGSDILWATVGVFPFSKAVGLFRGGGKLLPKFGEFMGDFVGLGGRATRGSVSGLLVRGRAAEVFHGSGALNKSGSETLRHLFTRANGASPLQRLLYGFDGATSAQLDNLVAGLPGKARNNLMQFLNGANGDRAIAQLLNDAPGSLDKFLHILDNPFKTGTGIADELGWL